MLSDASTTRLIYEPANVASGVFDGVVASQVPLPLDDGPEVDDVVSALTGTARGVWVDQLNETHVERRRVVKDVRALALAGAVRDRVSATPIVILVRHPIAVARSVIDLGWASDDVRADAFTREVSRWCELHATAFADERLSDVWFVSYEALRTDPVARLSDIRNYAATFDQDWARLDLSMIEPARRSATDFRTSAVSATENGWGDLDPALVEGAVDTLRTFDLDGLYDQRTNCREDVNEFARRFRVEHRPH